MRTSVLLAMCEYNRRLSSNLVHRVLANPSKEHLDKLMDVIQLGNLSSLSNVLDEEVLEFLRSLVSQPYPWSCHYSQSKNTLIHPLVPEAIIR